MAAMMEDHMRARSTSFWWRQHHVTRLSALAYDFKGNRSTAVNRLNI